MCLSKRLKALKINKLHWSPSLRIGRSGFQIIMLIQSPYDVVCRSDIESRIFTLENINKKGHEEEGRCMHYITHNTFSSKVGISSINEHRSVCGESSSLRFDEEDTLTSLLYDYHCFSASFCLSNCCHESYILSCTSLELTIV